MHSYEFENEEPPSPSIVVDGEEENEVGPILRHKNKGARCLYLVMEKVYPIMEAHWELKLGIQNACLLIEDYFHYPKRQDQWHQ